MAKSSRRIPPSRVKYEQAHPTVSGRVEKEQYDQMKAIMAETGCSFADLLKAGLGVMKENNDKLAEARRQGYQEGYAEADQFLSDAEHAGRQAGYAEAEAKFKVTYLCKVCLKPMAVTSTDAKKAIMQYMQEHGWGHKECHDRRP